MMSEFRGTIFLVVYIYIKQSRCICYFITFIMISSVGNGIGTALLSKVAEVRLFLLLYGKHIFLI